ncbi:MAG: spore coat associated protein CotJA [Oscillospiraceae bacterium]|nr:spore coat associated protein CotJA [Oscillospiraceae bacterium]
MKGNDTFHHLRCKEEFILAEMEAKHAMQMRDGEGRLPAVAPLANPYVPFQQENAAKYDAKKGLIRGTLFPGLDLPFMNMVNTKEKSDTPLHELQALGFAIQELALYLDTHRTDTEALELYRAYQDLYHKGYKEYMEKYAPLNHMMPGKGDTYDWLKDPWPWDYEGNQN